jgi:hypothetical protein
VHDLLINLLASAVAGAAVWSAQALTRYRRQARKRAFFGLDKQATCLLAVSRHAASPHDLSVHRRDVAALVELATIAKECGAQPNLIADNDVEQGVGRFTEFCVGGPQGNRRTAAHLRSVLHGVQVEPYGPGNDESSFSIGTATFRREREKVEYVLLARLWGPLGGKPAFVLSGQTARTNLAAARFLVSQYRPLYRRYGASKSFCVVLRVLEPSVFGPDFVEITADLTEAAFRSPDPAGSLAEREATPGGSPQPG